LWALILGILPNVPGFLITIKLIPADSVPEWIGHLYNYAWFVGFLVSGFIYWAMMKNKEVFFNVPKDDVIE
jgi:NCS1 family nucleobase:cation symporter-1